MRDISDEIFDEHRRRKALGPQEVTVTRIDLSFGNIFVLALKFGIVWFILGVLGALLVLAVS